MVILSATCQLESSKPGCASGDSCWCFQFVKAGSEIEAATGIAPVRLPVLVGCVCTALPFQVMAEAEVKTSMSGSVPLSPVSATVPPPSLLAAVRSRWVPRTSTGPAAVSCRQNVSAVALSASRSSSGREPPPEIVTRVRPSWV